MPRPTTRGDAARTARHSCAAPQTGRFTAISYTVTSPHPPAAGGCPSPVQSAPRAHRARPPPAARSRRRAPQHPAPYPAACCTGGAWKQLSCNATWQQPCSYCTCSCREVRRSAIHCCMPISSTASTLGARHTINQKLTAACRPAAPAPARPGKCSRHPGTGCEQ